MMEMDPKDFAFTSWCYAVQGARSRLTKVEYVPLGLSLVMDRLDTPVTRQEAMRALMEMAKTGEKF